jgi:ABC-2 type transport system permease protein
VRTIRTIAAREFHAMFRAPLAWVVLAVTQLVVAFQFLALIERFIKFQPNLMYLLIVLAPAVTMHSLSEERRSGTLQLLYSAPINATQLVLGKFLGVMGLFSVLWGLIALMPLTLLWGSTLDLGTYACGLLGLMLIMAAFCSAGLFISSLTAQPAVAAVGTLGMLFALLIIDWASGIGQDAGALAYLSMLNHFHRLAIGICDTADIAYFLVFITANLGLAVWKLDGDRRPV